MKLFTQIFRSVTSIELLRTSYLTENAPFLIKSTKLRKLYRVITAVCEEHHTMYYVSRVAGRCEVTSCTDRPCRRRHCELSESREIPQLTVPGHFNCEHRLRECQNSLAHTHSHHCASLVLCIAQLVAGLSLRTPGLDPRPIDSGYTSSTSGFPCQNYSTNAIHSLNLAVASIGKKTPCAVKRQMTRPHLDYTRHSSRAALQG